MRLFQNPIINLPTSSTPRDAGTTEANQEESLSGRSHPNLLTAYAVCESDDAFHVIQPYVEYSVHDVVTFSPALLSGTYTKPLFILYQVCIEGL